MRCPECGQSDQVFVIESRSNSLDTSIRRRRECRRCRIRWSTVEQIVTEITALPSPEPLDGNTHCHRCIQWLQRSGSCGLGFPEAKRDPAFAADCDHYRAA